MLLLLMNAPDEGVLGRHREKLLRLAKALRQRAAQTPSNATELRARALRYEQMARTLGRGVEAKPDNQPAWMRPAPSNNSGGVYGVRQAARMAQIPKLKPKANILKMGLTAARIMSLGH
jgi:hypothetical protein